MPEHSRKSRGIFPLSHGVSVGFMTLHGRQVHSEGTAASYNTAWALHPASRVVSITPNRNRAPSLMSVKAQCEAFVIFHFGRLCHPSCQISMLQAGGSTVLKEYAYRLVSKLSCHWTQYKANPCRTLAWHVTSVEHPRHSTMAVTAALRHARLSILLVAGHWPSGDAAR